MGIVGRVPYGIMRWWWHAYVVVLGIGAYISIRKLRYLYLRYLKFYHSIIVLILHPLHHYSGVLRNSVRQPLDHVFGAIGTYGRS